MAKEKWMKEERKKENSFKEKEKKVEFVRS